MVMDIIPWDGWVHVYIVSISNSNNENDFLWYIGQLSLIMLSYEPAGYSLLSYTVTLGKLKHLKMLLFVSMVFKQQIRVAQRKRGGPITHRSQDRNLALINVFFISLFVIFCFICHFLFCFHFWHIHIPFEESSSFFWEKETGCVFFTWTDPHGN